MKIGRKLLVTYFILLTTVCLVTGIAFRVLIERYLISEARTLLKTEAKAIAATLEKIPIFDGKARPNLLAKREMRIHGQFIDSKVIVMNNDRKIIYSNLEGNEKKQLQALLNKSRLNARQYVAERVSILSENGEVKGQVLLFTKLKDLKRVGKLINQTQLMSLVVGGAVAIILGMLMQRGLTRPIGQLKEYMTSFSLKDSRQELDIASGDEIEELAGCFSAMTEKLKAYDAQQKVFLQNTSHELKTPLMSIQGYAEAIKDGVVLGDEMEESLDVIIDESKRLKKFVEEMNYLIRLDNIEDTFHFEKTSIQEIINQGLRGVKVLLESQGLKLKVEGDCSHEGCYDGEKLVRALTNILGNAVRYANKEIVISCKTLEDYLEICITDDGDGFAEGEQEKVFERFYKGKNGGTGIGLAITKAIVEGHGGSIEAYNARPKGAAFRIELPSIQPVNRQDVLSVSLK